MEEIQSVDPEEKADFGTEQLQVTGTYRVKNSSAGRWHYEKFFPGDNRYYLSKAPKKKAKQHKGLQRFEYNNGSVSGLAQQNSG